MSNMRICHINRAKEATLGANPALQSASLVEYVVSDSRAFVARSVTVGTQTLYGRFYGGAVDIACLGLSRHNLVTNDSIRLKLYSDLTFTTMIYDSGTIDAYPDGLFDEWAYAFSSLWFPIVEGVLSFVLDITSNANPDGYIEVGTLFLGPYMIAARNPKYGAGLGWDDDSEHTRTAGGSLTTTDGEQWRVLSFEMEATNKADRAAWMEIAHYLGKSKSCMISVFPESTDPEELRDYTLFGKFTESPAQKLGNFTTYNLSAVILEI